MKGKILILLTIVLLTPGMLNAQKKDFRVNRKIDLPIIIGAQYAGNVGLVSASLGTAIPYHKFYIGLVYGYLPKSVNDVEVHTIALRASYNMNIRKLSANVFTSCYAGTNMNLGLTDKTYLSYPDYFPDKYYNANAFHVAPFIGQKIDFAMKGRIAESIGLYAELGTIDSYLFALLNIPNVPIRSIFNFCAGVSATIRRQSEKR